MFSKLAERLFANKFLLTATVISILLLALILVFSSSQKPTLNPTPTSMPKVSNPFSEFSNLTQEKIDNAISYRQLISDRLPIYLPSYKTSTGIETSIIISVHPSEPSLTRLDITGLSYLNKSELDAKKNPNIQAFQETFTKALQLLREAGIEPKQLLFDYGQADYVRVTANEWVDKLGLLR